ncbi:unnamed protein product [Fusarium fujikuroi]|uniref:Uncharacterized protein n=1 Tax=Fusarium fujikuroi TaxID=5127 RepID=A0A9Q9RBU8_FUSFU|nr:unnamed protein product [Fusarium fujikuroi]
MDLTDDKDNKEDINEILEGQFLTPLAIIFLSRPGTINTMDPEAWQKGKLVPPNFILKEDFFKHLINPKIKDYKIEKFIAKYSNNSYRLLYTQVLNFKKGPIDSAGSKRLATALFTAPARQTTAPGLLELQLKPTPPLSYSSKMLAIACFFPLPHPLSYILIKIAVSFLIKAHKPQQAIIPPLYSSLYSTFLPALPHLRLTPLTLRNIFRAIIIRTGFAPTSAYRGSSSDVKSIKIYLEWPGYISSAVNIDAINNLSDRPSYILEALKFKTKVLGGDKVADLYLFYTDGRLKNNNLRRLLDLITKGVNFCFKLNNLSTNPIEMAKE